MSEPGPSPCEVLGGHGNPTRGSKWRHDGGVEDLRGRLLVAGGGLFDPNFRQSVVLVVEHAAEGTLGVVLNRPAPVTVAEVAPALAELVGGDQPMLVGGPVAPDAALILAHCDLPDPTRVPVFDSVALVTGEVKTDSFLGVHRARVFAGHAGWGPGQLEAELDRADWIVEPAVTEDVFSERPEALWATVLRRKGGQYSLLARMPFDPSTN
jgi:putative transcriptional regulator